MDKERKPHKHTEAATSSPLLSIRGLSAAYDGRTVLHDVDLEVYEHDFLGIIGPNGGGKTTLIKCILGLLRPTGGEIIKYHEPLTTGYLPQYNSIDRSFPISVLEVVLSGLSSKKSLTGRFNDRHREKARQVIHRMGLEGLEHRAIGQLSGGQLQRALLGRAIISDPQLLILDEPTNDLDIMTLNVLEDYLKSFQGCLIIVSHDRFFTDKVVDRVFAFEGDGVVKDFPGNYTQYKNKKEEEELLRKQEEKKIPVAPKPVREKEKVRKLTFKERLEMQQLESDMEKLNTEKTELETALNSGTLDTDELVRSSQRIAEIIDLLDEKEMRWLELSEIE